MIVSLETFYYGFIVLGIILFCLCIMHLFHANKKLFLILFWCTKIYLYISILLVWLIFVLF